MELFNKNKKKITNLKFTTLKYLEKERTVKGSFQFIGKLFGIEFQEIEIDTWDSKVQVFDIKKDNLIIARLYADLEARKDKKGGAWMHNWVSRHNVDSKTILPSAFIVGNFPPSNGDNPSLLKPDDVVTLFHEMGHALHHLLTEIEEPFLSGINGVEWDAVEFPSQFLENFAYEKEALKFFAFHYKTGEALSSFSGEKLAAMSSAANRTNIKYQAPEKTAIEQHSHMLLDVVPDKLKNEKGEKVGRNDLCPCGSGKKYKKCCGK